MRSKFCVQHPWFSFHEEKYCVISNNESKSLNQVTTSHHGNLRILRFLPTLIIRTFVYKQTYRIAIIITGSLRSAGREFYNHALRFSVRSSASFSAYRCDRTTRQGGGVLLVISKQLPSQCIHTPSNLELVWAIIEINQQRVIVGVCYRPPNHSSTLVNELDDVINLVSSRHPTVPLFLLGEFNIPNISWAAKHLACNLFQLWQMNF